MIFFLLSLSVNILFCYILIGDSREVLQEAKTEEQYNY